MSSMPCSLTFLVLPRGPPMPTIAAWCFSTHAFQAAIPSCIFVCRASSERAFQAVIRALVLLPRKIARNVSFVLITSPFVQRSFCEASTLVSACLTFGSESGLLTTPASRPLSHGKRCLGYLRQCRGCMVLKSSLHC